MFQNLKNSIKQIAEMKVSDKRREILKPLAEFIQNKLEQNETINLNFICTHNSRRSHLSQIWAQTMAHYFRIDNVECFSGGTEATAMFPKVAETLTKQGFEITKLSENQNPVYAIKFDKNEMPVVGFSKKYDDPFNPESGFCAVMTCSSADQGCPFIAGADKRIPVRYEDPKMYDGHAEMDEKYLQKSLEIGQEMFYVFSKVAEL